MIQIACSGCEKKLRVDDGMAGKKVRCPLCQAVIAVPKPEPPAPPVPSLMLPEDLPAPRPVITAELAEIEPEMAPEPEPRPEPRRRRKTVGDLNEPPASAFTHFRLVLGAGLALLVMVIGVVAAGVAGAISYRAAYNAVAGALSGGPPALNWQPFMPPGAGYTVNMPGTPTENNDNIPPGGGQKFVLIRASAKLSFVVGHADMPGVTATPGNLRMFQVAERDHLIEVIKGKLLTEADVHLDGVAGREFRVEAPDGSVVTERVYLRPHGGGSRCFIVAAGCIGNDPAAATYLASFRFMIAPGGPPAPPPGEVVRPNPPTGKPKPPDRPKPPPPTGERPVWCETGSDRTIALAFLPDSRTLAVGHWDKRLRLWDAGDGKDRALNTNVGGPVTALAARGDGKQVAFGIGQGRVVLWDVEGNKEAGRFVLQHRFAKDHCKIMALAFAPGDKVLAAVIQANGSAEGEVHLWGLEENKLLKSMQRLDSPTRLAFVPGGKLVVFLKGTARVCDAATLDVQRDIKREASAEAIVAAAVSPDGRFLAALCDDKKLRLWEVATGDLKIASSVEAKYHRHIGLPMAFSPDGSYLAFGAQDNALWVYDARAGRAASRDAGRNRSGFVDLIAFSPDGKFLALHGYDGPKIIETAALKALLRP